MEKSKIIDEIIQMEWEAFDKARNEGGRAACQNDWKTFSIMRRSQYETWNQETLCAYTQDLQEAAKIGRNLIAEKYGRMMESTAPEQYDTIKDKMPELSEERKAITEEIVKIQVGWMEEFSKEYPSLANNARSIHTSEDNEMNTSFETYLRGEIGTYSDDTFVLYGRMIVEYLQRGMNLTKITMENTVRLYGYSTLKDAAAKMNA